MVRDKKAQSWKLESAMGAWRVGQCVGTGWIKAATCHVKYESFRRKVDRAIIQASVACQFIKRKQSFGLTQAIPFSDHLDLQHIIDVRDDVWELIQTSCGNEVDVAALERSKLR